MEFGSNTERTMQLINLFYLIYQTFKSVIYILDVLIFVIILMYEFL